VKAAESGRLVIAVMPTPSVVATVGQVLTMLPEGERELGRVRFADALRGVIAQQLAPRADGKGRLAVVEAVVATPAVREAIADPARLHEIGRIMERGEAGMLTLAAHARELVEAGDLAADAADTVTGGSRGGRRSGER
jgi:twitching motility protein PilT